MLLINDPDFKNSNFIRSYGPSMVVMGDSIDLSDDVPASNLIGNSWASYMMHASNAAVEIAYNTSTGGNTTAQMLARFATDVLARASEHVQIGGGNNDTTPATTVSNITAMIAAAQAAGRTVSIRTLPPQGSSGISSPVPVASAVAGGTLTAATYSYRVSAVNGVGETLASTAVTAIVDGVTTTAVQVSWPAIIGATSYKVYGRVGGAELLIASITATGTARPNCFYLDLGSVTPSGALPGSNTTRTSSADTATLSRMRETSKLLRALAVTLRIPILDFEALAADPVTGMWRVGWTTDATHPTAYANRKMGEYAWGVLGPYWSGRDTFIPWLNAPATAGDRYTNCLFQSNDGTKPTSWSPTGGSAIETMVTESPVKIYVKTMTAYVARTDGTVLSGNLVSGHRYAFVGHIKLTNADANGGQVLIALRERTGFTRIITAIINSDTTGTEGCDFCLTGIAPNSGAFDVQLNLLGYGPVTVEFSRMRVLDLDL